MGHRICDTILDFCDPDQQKVKMVLEELEIMLPSVSGGVGDKGNDGDSDNHEGSGQDSDYSDEGDLDTKAPKK
jgi:hypothetical protein